jgi:2-succinyl-5-enolpyruvyl-6-hydroxy-3-cyclohexene-1-carboxylate synthase
VKFQLLKSLAELCFLKGIEDVVLCPGSRSAPITLAFLRNKNIRCRTFSDERSAAFIALGIAQQTKRPVVLICTSGSAAFNFAPAVAEAFFQQIPLLVLTADRPKEWIDQLDGQTIRQTELFGKHVKKYSELLLDDPHPDAEWHTNRVFNESINLTQREPSGPVHINLPLREPLYVEADVKDEGRTPRVIHNLSAKSTLSHDQVESLGKQINSYQKILIIPGQLDHEQSILKSLDELHSAFGWPVVGDILSNLHGLPFFIRRADTFLGQISQAEKDQLAPDLIITFGKSLIAKNLKTFLRNCRPKAHWHLQTCGISADTFQSLTTVIPVEANEFFHQLTGLNLHQSESWRSYSKLWNQKEVTAQKAVSSFFDEKIDGEFKLVQQILSIIPSQCNVHLANSMSVRYANHIGLQPSQSNVRIFSNRGTSGIDGCTSTAVGSSLATSIPNILITGDQAFFYDRNAFWHNYNLSNLHVVILNNHGGIIFNLIDGPANLPETEEYFITRQELDARHLADEFGFKYFNNKKDLNDFFSQDASVKVFELESSQALNKKIFEEFKTHIRKSYGT